MTEAIRRSDVEERARAYLERSRGSNDRSQQQSRVSQQDFEEVVRKEVDQTIRQLRGIGKEVVD